MKKLVPNLSVRDYDIVEDLISELLFEHFGIEKLSFEDLEKDVEYVVGAINIVKLGSSPMSLKHMHFSNGSYRWSDDCPVTESYEFAEYYRLDVMNNLCKNHLSGKWSDTYNFNRVLNSIQLPPKEN